MRLADYVVSYSLQINNRCLRYLAECDVRGGTPSLTDSSSLVASDSHSVFAESLLARDTRRLVSMWSLMRPGWKADAPDLATHVDDLYNAAEALAEGHSGRRLAMRLASLASADHEAEAILKVARKLPNEIVMTWDVLNDLFAADSLHWRESVSHRDIDDDLVLKRIAKRYRKSYRLAKLMPEQEAEAWLNAHAENLYRWVQLCAHQLELLRPGLSDKIKAQLWYLDKMSDTLRTRAGLVVLRDIAVNIQVKRSAAKLTATHVDEQIAKMDKRIERLARGCFATKPKRLVESIKPAVAALGLRDVSFMKTPPVADAGRKGQATENIHA